MEHSIHNETTIPNHGANWQPRPELLAAMREIGRAAMRVDADTVIGDTEVSFQNLGNRTTITASPVGVTAMDGLHIPDRIDIRTELPPAFDGQTLEQLALQNTMMTTGPLVRDPESGKVVIASALTLFADDDEALARLYPSVVIAGAVAQAFGYLAAMAKVVDDFNPTPADLGVSNGDEPSRWAANEFEWATRFMRRSGIYCNCGESSITAEFAWDEGAVSSMTGDRTSLFRALSDVSHPTVGNGLFYRLDLPLTLERAELAERANFLNQYEITGTDRPPFFGAWCSQLDNGTLTYVGFWPNFMYVPGSLANIASWCKIRARNARQVLGNRH